MDYSLNSRVVPPSFRPGTTFKTRDSFLLVKMSTSVFICGSTYDVNCHLYSVPFRDLRRLQSVTGRSPVGMRFSDFFYVKSCVRGPYTYIKVTVEGSDQMSVFTNTASPL